MGNRRILEDCFFLDLHVPIYAKNWPRQPGPAHPGVFKDVFPALFKKLAGADRILMLHVHSLDPEYFNELAFIRNVLAPQHLDYVLLPSRLDPQYPAALGNLLFQWPSGSAQYIVDNW